jgi:diacylglycerol kinase family enzyme
VIDFFEDILGTAGGDGTINEVVNGIADTPVVLGSLPVGTAHVLAFESGSRARVRPVKFDGKLLGELRCDFSEQRRKLKVLVP